MVRLLGIDTGGTYTDAVILDEMLGVVATAKALTTKHDLAIGVRGAVERVLAADAEAERGGGGIGLVSLSTTLATNALVERHGRPVCLLAIGLGPAALQRAGLGAALGGDPVAFVAGGHGASGDVAVALDAAAVESAVAAHASRVSAFAVAATFAVRNPAHECQARDIIRATSGLPVTCSHEMSRNLDAPRRALTAVLNARLIPLLQELILAVRGLMEEKAIAAPLMVIKGDGSMIAAEVALVRPIETILSGPAASVVGARYLAGGEDGVVSDIGGTTTDIAVLRDGHPVLDPDGARVGGWRTMVEAIAVSTAGIGGDSETRLDEVDGLMVGPRRAMPLSLLAAEHPNVVRVLEEQLETEQSDPLDGRFALRLRPLGGAALSRAEQEVWDALAGGPVAQRGLLTRMIGERAFARLVDQGLAISAAFTPSDAAHVLGIHTAWSRRAAALGAALWARRPAAPGWRFSGDETDFSRLVLDRLAVQTGRALVAATLADDAPADAPRDRGLGRYLLDLGLGAPGAAGAKAPLLQVALTLGRPLIGIGAPAEAYYPDVARRLHTQLVVPPHAEVANAVGAVASGVVQTVEILITAPTDGVYRVHLGHGISDHPDLERAAWQAESEARRTAVDRARNAGAGSIQVSVQRRDVITPGPGGHQTFIESRVTATAAGRPRLAAV
jgi:N-methylhydantoinase A/oxoprolinase/acetone carboxylase beta subunit